jgi:hypothetical protein
MTQRKRTELETIEMANQFVKDYNTFQAYMDRLDNNETLTDVEMADFTYLAAKCGWRTIDSKN